jgi:MGT family glycosyltransferase
MGATFDDRFRFVGPSVGGRDSDGDWEREGTGPLLFISLGTTPLNRRPDFFRMCHDAFGGSEWDVAMAVGDQTSLADLGTIAPNVRARPFFPQVQVLRQTAVFITHAGMNSTMEALYYAVPMVAVPQQPEQAATARRLEELGLGMRLAPEDVGSDALRAAVTAVHTDARVRRNLAAMRDVVRNAGGAVAAADAIEAHVQHGAGRFGDVG